MHLTAAELLALVRKFREYQRGRWGFSDDLSLDFAYDAMVDAWLAGGNRACIFTAGCNKIRDEIKSVSRTRREVYGLDNLLARPTQEPPWLEEWIERCPVPKGRGWLRQQLGAFGSRYWKKVTWGLGRRAPRGKKAKLLTLDLLYLEWCNRSGIEPRIVSRKFLTDYQQGVYDEQEIPV
jgi:hypothetical protein